MKVVTVDVRLSRLFQFGETTRLRGSLDIHDIFNANGVLSMTPTYGSSWLDAAQVMSPR